MGGEAFLDIHPIKHIHFENTFSYVYSHLLHQTEDTRYLPFTPAPRITSELRFDILHTHQKPKQAVQNLWASAFGFDNTPDEIKLFCLHVSLDCDR